MKKISINQNFNMKNYIKNSLIVLSILLTIYLTYFKSISMLYSTILFIILGTILIISNWPGKYYGLFKTINKDDLNNFKKYLSDNGLKVTNIHKIEYVLGRTPILHAIETKAYNIFNYLVENNYDLKYFSEKNEPIIIFIALYGDIKLLNILLKKKDKIHLNVISQKLGANALEIAIWRGEKDDIVEALLDAGMNFSINNYNCAIGKFGETFDDVPVKTKAILIKKFVFNKTIKQLNMVNEIENGNIKSFKDKKIYWNEYLKFV